MKSEDEIFALCDQIRESSFSLHRYLRHGHLEKVYENGLAHRLRKAGLYVEQQHPFKVFDEDGTQVWTTTQGGASSVIVGDLDNDGLRDDFASGVSSIRVNAYNTSDGSSWDSYWNSSNVFSGGIRELTLGDFDKDGDNDIAGIDWGDREALRAFYSGDGVKTCINNTGKAARILGEVIEKYIEF